MCGMLRVCSTRQVAWGNLPESGKRGRGAIVRGWRLSVHRTPLSRPPCHNWRPHLTARACSDRPCKTIPADTSWPDGRDKHRNLQHHAAGAGCIRSRRHLEHPDGALPERIGVAVGVGMTRFLNGCQIALHLVLELPRCPDVQTGELAPNFRPGVLSAGKARD